MVPAVHHTDKENVFAYHAPPELTVSSAVPVLHCRPEMIPLYTRNFLRDDYEFYGIEFVIEVEATELVFVLDALCSSVVPGVVPGVAPGLHPRRVLMVQQKVGAKRVDGLVEDN